jgi:hypothetical protein
LLPKFNVEIDGDLTVKGTTNVQNLNIAGTESGGGPDMTHMEIILVVLLRRSLSEVDPNQQDKLHNDLGFLPMSAGMCGSALGLPVGPRYRRDWGIPLRPSGYLAKG